MENPLTIGRRTVVLLAGAATVLGCAAGPPPKPPELRTPATHPMKYFVSLPRNWSSERTWPVVLTFAGSGKDWEVNASAFAAERDKRGYSFIIVTPVAMTNASRHSPSNGAFDYDDATWDRIESEGRCQFTMDGLRAIMADVAKNYNGQSKAFVTGFSGGGQLPMALTYVHADSVRAAAFAASNFNGRCITKPTEVAGDKLTPQTISQAPERATLPIRFYNGSEDNAGSILIPQRDRAIAFGRENGFGAISAEIVSGAGHEPMVKQVLRFFSDQLSENER